jgi:hypothetical protein
MAGRKGRRAGSGLTVAVSQRADGLGQHAAFKWDKDFPVNGQLDQKVLHL